MIIHIAKEEDAEKIVQVMNLSYRGEGGWTSEKDLVSGARSELNGILSDIKSKDMHLLTCKQDGQIIACIGIKQKCHSVEIGTFGVLPNFQDKGLGQKMLKKAEEFSVNKLNVKEFNIQVLSNREELIEFYQRRGYVKTGTISPYPVGSGVGTPVNPAQTIENLVKYA